jgi:hypothetical protein
VENLKAVLTQAIEQAKPFLIVAAASFALGLVFGLWI